MPATRHPGFISKGNSIRSDARAGTLVDTHADGAAALKVTYSVRGVAVVSTANKGFCVLSPDLKCAYLLALPV